MQQYPASPEGHPDLDNCQIMVFGLRFEVSGFGFWVLGPRSQSQTLKFPKLVANMAAAQQGRDNFVLQKELLPVCAWFQVLGSRLLVSGSRFYA